MGNLLIREPLVSLPLTIVTHAGAFHSDEIMALVLLEEFYLAQPLRFEALSAEQTLAVLQGGPRPALPPRLGPDGLEDHRTGCWVVRTRNAEHLEAACANPEVMVLDVGGQHDAAALNFDHHQSSMTDCWEDGTPLSSTGLVWRWLKEQGLLTIDPGEQLELEETLIRPLDAHDNGQAEFDVAGVCEDFNRLGSDNDIQLHQFQKAMAYVREVWGNHRFKAVARAQARPVLAQAWEQAQERGERFVVLEESLAYPDGTGLLKSISNDQALLLAIPGKGSRFSVISVPENDRFSIRCPLPEEWRGQMDFDVELEGQPVRLAFAHKTGFMGVVQGSAQDVGRVCRHVVERFEVGYQPRRRAPGLR